MTIELTKEQQKQLDSLQEKPLYLVDPRTSQHYVLLREEDYKEIQELLEEEKMLQVIHRIGRRNAVKRMTEELS